MVNGYLHRGYAESLREFGAPICLPECRGWVLERNIPGFDCTDAMGCYPLFACQDWSKLPADLEQLQSRVVTLALVTDPFGNYDVDLLNRCFDRVIAFKQHFVIDLNQSMRSVSRHHTYYARKALRTVSIEICAEGSKYVEEWKELYAELIKRHHLTGIRAFSGLAIQAQLNVPGLVMFRASCGGETVGFHLWYQQGEVGYHHLAAFNDTGYRIGASYALMSFIIDYFRDKIRWLDLGGAAGTTESYTDGLAQFKKGWSTSTRTAFFCGRIFNDDEYSKMVNAKLTRGTNYFPAYRDGEFIRSAGELADNDD